MDKKYIKRNGMTTDKKRIVSYIGKKQEKELKKYTKRSGLAVSDVIRRSLDLYFEAVKPKHAISEKIEKKPSAYSDHQ